MLRLHRRTPPELAAVIRLRAIAHLGIDARLEVAPNWKLAATASARTPRTSIRLVPNDPAAVAASCTHCPSTSCTASAAAS
ncbi:hypothetical protein [Streptomyces zagrosensis]|uniref:Uncharacterized protein n=1 Tax=Streptomyces zagrosensis TaxID=1042984 RepID=A0A7W9QG70_9ACTN|nr:hypothetical protein [Streptomyces zagrosensis]MBB5938637.1 hypothetical protein [Streptomyces zagrosensis]